jgi:hypothetical protein
MTYVLSSTTNNTIDTLVEEGLDFILSHFPKDSLWPRKISTKTTDNGQRLVNSKEEALAWFKAAKYLDCRISAYPVDATTVDLIMIDLDQSRFKSRLASDRALAKTLDKIKDTFFEGIIQQQPTTVLWTGNGYHIYIPIESRYALERRSEFTRYVQEPSKHFLRFAEKYLSNGKADPEHYKTVSFKNCMLRVPGSINSKCGQQVRIVNKWNNEYYNNSRVPLFLLLGSFLAYLVDQNLSTTTSRQISTTTQQYATATTTYTNNKITWIESLLQSPILLSDGRKYCLWRILAPYLMNVRKLQYEESFNIIKEWLDRCNQVRRLDFNPNTKLKETLARVGSYYPISLEKLKQDNNELYQKIVN